MAEFSSSVTLNCSATVLRDYLGVTANLPEISDPELSLEVLTAPEQVAAETEIEFRISAYGFKQKMKHRYVVASNLEIVAEQIEGPTRAWRHTQTITPIDDGSCKLTDHVDFEPPGGMLGYLMTADKIKESLQDGMEFRYEALTERLG